MFIGHFAAGMAAKRADARISLGTLFLAAQFLDLLWPTLLLLNIEHVAIEPGTSAVTPLNFIHYPYSHSLLLVLGWSILFGAVYYIITRSGKGAWILGSLVLSHWVLDLVVHVPDLPIFPGKSPKVGLALWNSPILTILVEGALFVTGILLYAKSKHLSGHRISWWFWSLALFMLVIYILNLTGPPPPDVEAIAWAGHLQWLFIPWAWWADRRSFSVAAL